MRCKMQAAPSHFAKRKSPAGVQGQEVPLPKKESRPRRCWPRHVWDHDFVQGRRCDGRRFRMLMVINGSTRECLAIVAGRGRASDDMLRVLPDLFVERGPPGRIRSDNGPAFVAKVVHGWLGRVGRTTLFTETGSPWENGCNESFSGKLRNGLLDREIFYSLRDTEVRMERWRRRRRWRDGGADSRAPAPPGPLRPCAHPGN